MDASDGFVEFYIACNPPLLPKGVQHIATKAKTLLSESELVELLYEPEIPWFKCITPIKCQDRVRDLLQGLLTPILEDETESIVPGAASLDIFSGDVVQPDVCIIGPDPHLVPWSVYESREEEVSAAYDDYRFPEIMLSLKFKTVWRGLESSRGGTITNLLLSFRSWTKDKMAPVSISGFGDLMKCHISHNMMENLIYIGTEEPVHVMERAVQKLETMLSFLVSKPHDISHFILTEGPGPLRLTYRWLTHIGLARTTFSIMERASGILDHRSLTNAVTIRTEKKDRHGRWISDNTVYPLPADPDIDVSKHWAAFREFKFSLKDASPTFQARPYKIYVSPDTVKQRLNADLKELNIERNPNTRVQVTSPGLEDILGAPIAQSSNKEVAFHEKRFQQSNSINQGTPCLTKTLIVGNFIDTWRDTVGNAIPQKNIQASKHTIDTEDLISFDHNYDSFKGESLGNIPQNSIPEIGRLHHSSEPSFYQSDDLISLVGDQDPQPSLLVLANSMVNEENPRSLLDSHSPDTNMQLASSDMQISLNNNDPLEELSDLRLHCNPLEDQGPVGSEGHNPNAILRFGVMKDVPREFFHTMNQKGSRDMDRRLKMAVLPNTSINGGQVTQAKAGQGSCQDLDNASKRSQSNLKTPVIKDDNEWPTLGQVPPSPKKRVKTPLLYSDATKSNKHQTPGNTIIPQAQTTFLDVKKDTGHPQLRFEIDNWAASKVSTINEVVKEFVPALPGKSEILEATELKLRDMARILQLTSGNVNLEVKFGRIFLTQLPPSLVHNGSGPSFLLNETLETLNGSSFSKDRVGFSSILTTQGGDADMLPKITPPGEPPWYLSKKEAWYDFICSFTNQDDQFTIEVDADSFTYRCMALTEELFSVYLHCPQNAWDMKACGTRSSILDMESKYRSVAEVLIAGFSVKHDHNGDPELKITEGGSLGVTINSLNIRQIAQYRQKGRGKSLLSITHTRRMKCNNVVAKATGRRGLISKSAEIWSLAEEEASSSSPARFFEASISSDRTKPLFEQNAVLQYGDKTCWEADDLHRLGVFEDMCRPAFGMITHMDHIGSKNNNNGTISGQDTIYEGSIDFNIKRNKVEFW